MFMVVRMSAWSMSFCCTATGVPTASNHERYVCLMPWVAYVVDPETCLQLLLQTYSDYDLSSVQLEYGDQAKKSLM